MTTLPIYQVDAFTDQLYKGNPAAVCIMQQWLPDQLMQEIAAENNLAETAFIIPHGNDFAIRWFTPATEVDLCGHATLASAYVFFEVMHYAHEVIHFHSQRSGILKVRREQDMLWMDFPSDQITAVPDAIKESIAQCIGFAPMALYKGKTDYMAALEHEEQVRQLKVNLDAISQLDARGLIVTAPGTAVDFVSRFFAPQSGIDEDPVTGSAHTTMIPYWARKLHKTNLTAAQCSPRGGQIACVYNQDRCLIGGHARLYLTGQIRTEA